MDKRFKRNIIDVWHDFENEYPDKSTEWLVAITADVCQCDHTAVYDALYKFSREEKNIKK